MITWAANAWWRPRTAYHEREYINALKKERDQPLFTMEIKRHGHRCMSPCVTMNIDLTQGLDKMNLGAVFKAQMKPLGTKATILKFFIFKRCTIPR